VCRNFRFSDMKVSIFRPTPGADGDSRDGWTRFGGADHGGGATHDLNAAQRSIPLAQSPTHRKRSFSLEG
jgi:hypothetical protein